LQKESQLDSQEIDGYLMSIGSGFHADIKNRDEFCLMVKREIPVIFSTGFAAFRLRAP